MVACIRKYHMISNNLKLETIEIEKFLFKVAKGATLKWKLA